MHDNAISSLKIDAHPIIYSDRGAHDRWPGWIKRMDYTKLIRRMSRKGCSLDNSYVKDSLEDWKMRCFTVIHG